MAQPNATAGQPQAPAASNTPETTRQGNHGHGRAVPWLPDEEEYIKGLIIITRNETVSWNELATAANEYFSDKPIQQPDGTIISRGTRTGQSIRQHQGFEDAVTRNWWYRLDVEWKDVGGPGVVTDWAAFRAEVTAREERATAEVFFTLYFDLEDESEDGEDGEDGEDEGGNVAVHVEDGEDGEDGGASVAVHGGDSDDDGEGTRKRRRIG